MAETLKVYTCLTNNHTKVISLYISKPFPVMVECHSKEECSYRTRSSLHGKPVCIQAGQMDEKTFSRIELRNSIPSDPA